MSVENLPAVRHSVSEVREMAKAVAQSRLFGMDEPQLMTLMLLAQAKGIHPIQAVERYHVIQNRPAMKADAMLADFMAQGGSVEWHDHDHTKCAATFHAPRLKSPVTVTWTMEDAKKADLLKNAMWQKFSRQMLKSRVISEGIRMAMPGIVAGIYTPEEVSDFEPARETRATVVETRQAPAKPQNNSGHATGQYASPAQVEAYRVATLEFCREKNAIWADEWANEQGELPVGITDVLHPHQMTMHLMKFLLRTGKLAQVSMTFDPETGKPTEKVSIESAKKYVAIVYAREPETIAEEAELYFGVQAEAARAVYHAADAADYGEDDTAETVPGRGDAYEPAAK